MDKEPYIYFEYQGKQYRTSTLASKLGKIVLPDGRLFQVAGAWGTFNEVPHSFQGLSPESLAKTFNAVVADEVTKIDSAPTE